MTDYETTRSEVRARYGQYSAIDTSYRSPRDEEQSGGLGSGEPTTKVVGGVATRWREKTEFILDGVGRRLRRPPNYVRPTQSVYSSTHELHELRSNNTSTHSLPNVPLGTGGQECAAETGKWFKPAMLLDRSLLLLSGTVVMVAISMIITCSVFMKRYFSLDPDSRKYTTAVEYGPTGDCERLERNNAAIQLFINCFATIVLEASNTYQQLATGLTAKDLKYALHNFGDAPVGTNSPSALRYKRWPALFSWLFLVVTSLPIHLVANSFVGLSFSYGLLKVQYQIHPDNFDMKNITTCASFDLIMCWKAMTIGKYPSVDRDFGFLDYTFYNSPTEFYDQLRDTFRTVITVHMPENCTHMKESLTFQESTQVNYSNPLECEDLVVCTCERQSDNQPPCRANIRMSAAWTLAFCLTTKAIYMAVLNYRSHGKQKTVCMSFGDVVASAIIDPDLQIHNECMADADAIHRRAVKHTCHKHCRTGTVPNSIANIGWVYAMTRTTTDPVPIPSRSETGDELGHCQKCRKLNDTDHAAHLPMPVVATKFKKALITTLGGASVVQMLTLMFVSMAMLGVSCYSASIGINEYQQYKKCLQEYPAHCSSEKTSLDSFLHSGIGSMTSSLPFYIFPPDNFSSEILAFMASNGPQLVYSALYLLLIYNLTLICMEREWGRLERRCMNLRATLVTGDGFRQSYFLQIPKEIQIPVMIFTGLMHWLLGQSITARGYVITGLDGSIHTAYDLVCAPFTLYAATILIIIMTGCCWLAFFNTREGFIPTMYGSVRRICAATAGMTEVRTNGVKWGDLEAPKDSRFRRAGLSSGEVEHIRPGELYA